MRNDHRLKAPRATPAQPAMTIDTRTVAELQKDDFTHIEAHCPGCDRTVEMPFRMLLTQKRITAEATVAELRRRYRCKRCGGTQADVFRPVRH